MPDAVHLGDCGEVWQTAGYPNLSRPVPSGTAGSDRQEW